MSNVAALSFEKAPAIVTEIPGPLSRKIVEKQNRLESRSRVYGSCFPIALQEAKGSTVKDVDGNIYIDWFAAICVQNLGHAHPIVVSAIKKQLDRVVHYMDLPTEERLDFVETLYSTLPGMLSRNARLMFTVTGADACEAAMSLARKVTGKKTVIAFGGAYHGVHGAVVGATANFHYREFAGVPAYEIYHIPYPYSYRFPFKVREGEEGKVVAEYLEYLINDDYSGAGNIAGVLVEPVQGEGGYVVPPDDFLPLLREVTEKHSIPLIVDEVQSGVGRTGKIWATEHSKITPDIVCISKSIGGGVPMSLVAYRQDYDDLPPGFHLGTYRGNPLGIAAGNAVLKFLKSSDILERVRVKGEEIRRRFERICAESPYVGEVRGKGFMIGIEMVETKSTRSPGTKQANQLRSEMLKRGLLMHTCGHYSNVLRFMAPLTIEDQLLDAGLKIFQDSLRTLKP